MHSKFIIGICRFSIIYTISLLVLLLNVYAIEIYSCQTLTEPNSYYTLHLDLIQPLDEDCIIIAAENITLDCQGYSITSSSKAGIAGIYSDQSYTTITNCNVSAGIFSAGIQLLGANYSHIHDNILNNQNKGLFLIDVHNTLIENNIANFNGYTGLKLTTDWGTSAQNTIIGNTLRGNYIGINLIRSLSSTVTQNTANDNYYAGIWLGGGANNIVDRNTADNNSHAGFILEGASDNTIRMNNANHNSQYGIYILSSSLNNDVTLNKFCFNSDKDVFCIDNQSFTNNWCDQSGSVCGGYCIPCSEYVDTCVDGTINGECSTLNPPLYCDYKYLVFDPNKCGADAGKCCQSDKGPVPYATYLAVNLPYTEDCSNANSYFDNSTVGYIWFKPTFTEKPGIATVGGGYPTRVICTENPFDVMPPRPRAGRPLKPYHGVRYKDNACIFVPWSDTLGGKQEQVAILDYNYSKNSYCLYDGNNVLVKGVTFQNITLVPGWNLISLPLIPVDPSVGAVMQGCNYNKIWTFESDQSWNTTDTGLTSMDVTHGYWIDRVGLPGNCELSVKGTIPSLTQINVNSQWTLVGYPSLFPELIDDILQSIPYNKIWTFEADQSWKTTDTGLLAFKPGNGYWIDSSVIGIYNITN